MTFLWFTERKSIMMDMFYKKMKDNTYKKNWKNYRKWKEWDIVDMSLFTIYEFVENKKKDWYKLINNKTIQLKFFVTNVLFLFICLTIC
jgi:hypothetical protein